MSMADCTPEEGLHLLEALLEALARRKAPGYGRQVQGLEARGGIAPLDRISPRDRLLVRRYLQKMQEAALGKGVLHVPPRLAAGAVPRTIIGPWRSPPDEPPAGDAHGP